MGIQGLLKALEPVLVSTHISHYKTKRAAIDASCWLHRSAYCCSMELVLNLPTHKYLNFCMHYIHLLRNFGVIPVVVFDGANLPMKEKENTLRNETRMKYKEQAIRIMESSGSGDSSGKKVNEEAIRYFQRAVCLTSEMVRSFISVLKEAQVEYVISPYEADAQMSYMYKNNLVDFVISEDSDLLAFGCDKVFFKMDRNGYGKAIDFDAVKTNNQPQQQLEGKDDKFLKQIRSFSPLQFLQMCILSGCDYLSNIQGVGLKTAAKYMYKYQTPELVFFYLRKDKKQVPEDYVEKFNKAQLTFLHQRVYDLQQSAVRFLSPFPQNQDDAVLQSISLAYEYLGKHIPSSVVCGIAKGDVHPLKWEPYEEMPIPKALLNQIINVRTEAVATKRRRENGYGNDFFVEITQAEIKSSFVASRKKSKPISFSAPVPVSLDVDILRIQSMYEFESEADSVVNDKDFELDTDDLLTQPLATRSPDLLPLSKSSSSFSINPLSLLTQPMLGSPVTKSSSVCFFKTKSVSAVSPPSTPKAHPCVESILSSSLTSSQTSPLPVTNPSVGRTSIVTPSKTGNASTVRIATVRSNPFAVVRTNPFGVRAGEHKPSEPSGVFSALLPCKKLP